MTKEELTIQRKRRRRAVAAKAVVVAKVAAVVKEIWPIITKTILAGAAVGIGIIDTIIEAVGVVEEEESLVRDLDLDRGHVLPSIIITAAVGGDGVVVEVAVVIITRVIQLEGEEDFLVAYPRVFLNQ